jgi:outer membrane immunogenic protein
MKMFLVSTTALALLGGAAAAADLPAFEPAPVMAPVPAGFTWTGPYVGLAAGYAWGDAEINEFDGDNDEEFDVNGWLAGGFVGYNYQFPSALVLGIEADLEWTGIDGDGSDGDDDDDDDDGFSADVNWQGSLRARLGYAFDRALIYATGGLAAADVDGEFSDGDDDDDDDSSGNTEWGWTLGAGVDFAVTDNVFVRGEYRYTNLSDFDNDDDAAEIQDLTSHTVRVGVGVLF